MMKALHLNTYADTGGAAKAALRICQSLRGIDCNASVVVASSQMKETYIFSDKNPLGSIKYSFLNDLSKIFIKLSGFRTENKILHSPNLFSCYSTAFLESLLPDIIHFHWIAANLLSIEEVAKLTQPLVWTLHDMWAFCGAEHYTEDLRWKEGYYSHNRPAYERGFDLNRWTWERKRKYWQKPIHIVAPSHWLADCVRQSALMHNWPVSVIPNPINTEKWYPYHKKQTRQNLGLPTEVPIVLFGAMGGGRNVRKGFDLLKEALDYLKNRGQQFQIVVFGESEPRKKLDLKFPVQYAGHIDNEEYLCRLYSAADVMIVPSRQDNLPNTAIEAQACGTPVVAFRIGGLPDIITHQQTGYLAQPFDATDLADGIQWVLADSQRHAELCDQARADAVRKFAYPVVAKQYLAVYEEVLERHRQQPSPVQ
ncbi:glycosyltransferase family 4 protein [Thermosynechococcus sp. QKsg1]|uniref:glycosyltransferase family 4 protein n=1 Tax=Thermosynechococcus sp. QKsg1 TaxID=3074130 RepID=UPI0028772C5C|nr:glycosyltransferase family 4 protein [Thermosynechococcus sp. QKsg1]WNC86866.1 glycosyltransferase family 4 protein [Thermosynechococcus sp. QKsg1]